MPFTPMDGRRHTVAAREMPELGMVARTGWEVYLPPLLEFLTAYPNCRIMSPLGASLLDRHPLHFLTAADN